MIGFLRFIKINDYAVTTLGIAGNILLLYLIFTTQKKELKSLSRLLIQTCVLDMGLSIITAFCQPHTFIKDKIFYAAIGGYINNKDYIYATIMIAAYMSLLFLNICAMPVPFYLRYLVICRKMSLSTAFSQKLFKAYIPVVFTVFVICGCVILAYPPNSDCITKHSEILDTNFWRDEYHEIPLFICSTINAWPLILACSVVTMSTTVSYSFVVFYCIRIFRGLQSMKDIMSEKTKEMNAQVNRALIFQAGGPLIVGTGPILTLMFMIFFTIENSYASITCATAFAWIPIVNPVATIIIIAPYRQRIVNLFRPTKAQVSDVNVVEVPRDLVRF